MDKHNLLHPPMNVKKLKKKDEALLIKHICGGKFYINFMNAKFELIRQPMEVPVIDLSKFLVSIACGSVKAVIFILFNYNSQTVNLEIRQMVYKEVRKRKWQHIYLVHPKTNSMMSMLFSSKSDSNPGDVILNVIISRQMVSVYELRRKKEGYSIIADRKLTRYNRTINGVATECLGTCDPKYVIVLVPQCPECNGPHCNGPQCNDLVMSLKSHVVSSKNVISIVPENTFTSLITKTIFERGCNQLIPYSMNVLVVSNVSNLTAPEQAVITVAGYNDLPLEKALVVPKSKKPYFVEYLYKVSGIYKSAGKAQESKEKKGHRIKLALVVDRNSLPFLYQEPFIIPEIEALPQKLASSQPNLNVPFIGFFDNSSVICVRDENGYKFLKEWKGLYGNDLYLNLEQEKPIIVTDLQKVKDNDPFVVYDLIKVLSMPANDIKADPNWGFKVISDAENSVSLKVDTFSGSGQKATPVFLMALLLKHHIKTIKNATRKKPTELGYCLYNEFTNEEKNRIHTGFEEACKLLKIGIITLDHL